MAAPIPPSLSQLLNPQTAPARPQPQIPQSGGFATAVAAQKAFFSQVTTTKVTPPTYTAADIAKAAQTAQVRVQAQAPDMNPPLKRPGSYLNIVI